MFVACHRTEIEPGEGLRIDGPETHGVPVAVFHTEEGEFYAIDDTCTHQDASLAEGWLEGCEVECPLHASRFDLRTGAVDAPPAKRPVRTHQVTVDGDDVWLTLSTEDPNLPPGRLVRSSGMTPSDRPAPPGRRRRRLPRRHVDGQGAAVPGVRRPAAVVGDELHRPYDRPPLSKDFLPARRRRGRLARGRREDLGVEWRLGVPAIGLRPRDGGGGLVRLADGDELAADALVIATGARARRELPGTDLPGVHLLRTLDDAVALRADLHRAASTGEPVVVVGGGFIGSEVAATACELGCAVTLVVPDDVPLRAALGPYADAVAGLHISHGVRVRAHGRVQEIRRFGVGGLELVLADGRRIPAATVVLGIGAVPAVDWLIDSGLEFDHPGSRAIACDEREAPTSWGSTRWGTVRPGSAPVWATAPRSSIGPRPRNAAPSWRPGWSARTGSRRVARRTSGRTCTGRSCNSPDTASWPTTPTDLSTRWRSARSPRVVSRRCSGAPGNPSRCWPSTGTTLRPGPAHAGHARPHRRRRHPRMIIAGDAPQPDPSILEPTGDRISDSLMRTLPGHAYSSPTVFAREQAKIFEQMWICAARASELPKAGDFITVQVGRESIIVSRNRKRELRGFFNICRHRGARVCSSESGSGKRSFQCPYHAWTYDLDGKLIAAPNLTKMPDIGREEYGLHAAHVREWLGYVWVCVADEPPSFEDSVMGAVRTRLGDPELIEHYAIETLEVGRRISYDVRANWKLIVENFMECYHCATIHPELTEVLPEFADGLAAQYFVGHGAAFGDEVQGFTVDGSAGLERIPGVTEDQDRRYFAVTVRPGVFVNLVPDHVIFHRMFPVAPDRTTVVCDWLYLPQVVASGVDLTKSVELFDLVNRQDFAACELCQAATDSRKYAQGGVLVPSEHHIADFQTWASETIAD